MTIISLLICLAFMPLCLFYSAIGLITAPQKWKKYIPFLIYSLFVIAYSYNPIGTPDLVRYIDLVQSIENTSLPEAIKILGDGLFVEDFYFWFIAQLEDYNLLGAIPITITYAIAIYILCDISADYKAEKYIPYLMALLFALLPFINILSNLRNITAFAVIVYASYEDLIKKKRNAFIIALYILPCFFHRTAVLILALRLVVYVANWLKPILIALVAVAPIAIDLLFFRISLIPSTFLQSLIRMIYWYFHDDLKSEYSRAVSRSGADLFNRMIFIGLAIVFIIIILRISKKYVKHEYNLYNTFVFSIAIVTIACYPVVTPQYWRFAAAFIIAGWASVLIPALINRTRDTLLRVICYLLPVFSALGLFMQIWNTRYIVDYGDFFSNIILNNVYVVLYHLLRGIMLM